MERKQISTSEVTEIISYYSRLSQPVRLRDLDIDGEELSFQNIYLDLKPISITFKNCHFQQKLIVNPIANTKFTVEDCFFEKGIIVTSTQNIELKIIRSEIKKSFVATACQEIKIHVEDCKVRAFISFNQSTFTDCLIENLSQTDTSQKLSIRHYKFTHSLFIANSKFAAVQISLSSMKGQTTIQNCMISGQHEDESALQIHDTNFAQPVYISLSNFFHRATLHGCRFDSRAILSLLGNSEKQPFPSLTINQSQFLDSFTLQASPIQTLSISNSFFLEHSNFRHTRINVAYFENLSFQKTADFQGTVIQDATRETYRTIKTELQKLGNSLDANRFATLELRRYFVEQPTTIKTLPLLLSKLSNDFGDNWLRGIMFTITVAVSGFTTYLLTLPIRPYSWGWQGWSAFWSASSNTIRYFFSFLDVTHELNFMAAYGATGAHYFLDTLTRIFIGYGIFQTVAAFRRNTKI